MPRRSKTERHQRLLEMLESTPFLTDEELARGLGVSIQTIRLDRMELDVAELRERIRTKASDHLINEQFIQGYRLMGDLMELEPGKKILSLLVITPEMTVPKNGMVRPYYLVAQAHTAALQLFPPDEEVFTSSANVKFIRPVQVKERILALAEVVETKGNRHRVKVVSRSDQERVFRATFIICWSESERKEDV
ncbi:MAG: DeoR family transcriptional regulator [Firmicutes bacterium]|nr:DeoR family transcriptional regulator [Bacillota bacterium]